jgi:hypothetical protein
MRRGRNGSASITKDRSTPPLRPGWPSTYKRVKEAKSDPPAKERPGFRMIESFAGEEQRHQNRGRECTAVIHDSFVSFLDFFSAFFSFMDLAGFFFTSFFVSMFLPMTSPPFSPFSVS